MVKKQDIVDLYEEIRLMDIPTPDDTLIGNSKALGYVEMKQKVLDLIKERFA